MFEFILVACLEIASNLVVEGHGRTCSKPVQIGTFKSQSNNTQALNLCKAAGHDMGYKEETSLSGWEYDRYRPVLKYKCILSKAG